MEQQTIPLSDIADRQALARVTQRLFAHWQLTPEEQLSILGLSMDHEVGDGNPLPNCRDTIERVGHLLAIHANLRQLFSHSRKDTYAWIRLSNRAFDGHSPFQMIEKYGFSGLLMVRTYLEKAMNK